MRTETCQKSLYERAVEAEHRRHASRLKELRAGQKKLALLGSIEPQLNAAGITLYASDLKIWRGAVYDIAGWGQIGAVKLAAWLRANGFRETLKHRYDSFSAVTFSKGHLKLDLHLPVQRVAP